MMVMRAPNRNNPAASHITGEIGAPWRGRTLTGSDAVSRPPDTADAHGPAVLPDRTVTTTFTISAQ